MDEVDQQQQKEIEDLKEVNRRQDDFTRSMVWAFVVFALIQLSTVFFYLFQFSSTFSNVCPHNDCPHHTKTK